MALLGNVKTMKWVASTVEGPLDTVTLSVSHHISYGASVSDGLHVENFIGPVASATLDELTLGLARPHQVPRRELVSPEAHHGPRALWRVQSFLDVLCIFFQFITPGALLMAL